MSPRKLPRKKNKPRVSRKSSRQKNPGPAFAKLAAVMSRLRAPGGCPWDREQTHHTLRTYLIEEAYELLDALDANDDVKFAEELGDLLLQVLFHSQIAREAGRFSITDVIREIHEKMVRRHPHVFGEKRAKNAAEVLHNWEIIKREERRAKSGAFEPQHKPESLLDGVPRSLPALVEGYQLTSKAARIGFDWDNIEGVFDKLREEIRELRQVLANNSTEPTVATTPPPESTNRHPERSEGSLFGPSSKQASPAESTSRHPERSDGPLFDPSSKRASPP